MEDAALTFFSFSAASQRGHPIHHHKSWKNSSSPPRRRGHIRRSGPLMRVGRKTNSPPTLPFTLSHFLSAHLHFGVGGSSSAAWDEAQWSNSPRMATLGRSIFNYLIEFRQCSLSRQREGSLRSSWRCSVWCSGGDDVQLLLPEIFLGFENTPGAG